MQYINKIETLQNSHNKLAFRANKSLEIKQIGQIVNKKQESAIGT
jgi:predicted patatin/cPLA2 family phospholipase